MTISPASHAEQIRFHENALARHPDDLPISAQISHETKLAELDATDPFAVERREIEDQLARPLSGPERAVLEQALRTVKTAQAQHAGAQLWRTTLSPEARVFWTRVHTSATAGPDISPAVAARDFMNQFGTVAMSEGQPPQQDEPSAEDRIVAIVNGTPLPDEPRSPEIDPERLRRLAEDRARWDETDRLLDLSDGLHLTWSADEAGLFVGWLDAESDERARGLFELTPRERAAAELLRRERDGHDRLRALQQKVRENGEAFDAIAAKSRGVDLAERSVYQITDAHGAELLCIDFPIKTNPTT